MALRDLVNLLIILILFRVLHIALTGVDAYPLTTFHGDYERDTVQSDHTIGQFNYTPYGNYVTEDWRVNASETVPNEGFNGEDYYFAWGKV